LRAVLFFRGAAALSPAAIDLISLIVIFKAAHMMAVVVVENYGIPAGMMVLVMIPGVRVVREHW
jgi:hypothetical protein